MKLFLVIIFAVLFSFGCATTIKRPPIDSALVQFYETKGKWVLFPKEEQMYNFKTHQLRPIIVAKTTNVPMGLYLKNSQPVGKVIWSGIIPEIDVPESASDQNLAERDKQLGDLQDLPDRVKNEMKERAGQLGGNLVFVNRWGYTYRWVVEGGRYQPNYTFWGEAFFVTNQPPSIFLRN
ncbi:MAG TPA: hypothetical protein VN516_07325 [Candidatus Baltobacteraceae bacterium]|nr:hypothetical protein [Candidatus Baltobacteraceae bacterium]